jgi:hypothetical protein
MSDPLADFACRERLCQIDLGSGWDFSEPVCSTNLLWGYRFEAKGDDDHTIADFAGSVQGTRAVEILRVVRFDKGYLASEPWT